MGCNSDTSMQTYSTPLLPHVVSSFLKVKGRQ